MSDFHLLRVASCKPETREALVVTFEVPEELREEFRFTQGQHLTVRTKFGEEELRRSYSICAAPADDVLRIAIKRVPDGRFSSWANNELRPGHLIECMRPTGHFHVPLQPEAARHHVAFVAGSGITPVLSLIKTTLAAEPMGRFTLIYGNRSSSSVIFKEELEDLKDTYLDRFNLVFILSRERQEIDLFNGRIDRAKCDDLLRCWIDPTDIDVAYLCGPQSMMQDVSGSLLSHGVEKDRVKIELFGAANASSVRASVLLDARHDACSVTVIRDGHVREFSMQRNKHTVLESALEQGVDLPYSCKGGVCSTCRCKMVTGEVDMDVNFALEDYEVARGFILTCQSYALSDKIVLDYDQES